MGDRFDFVLVLDDSGSMQSRTKEGRTRWEELMEVTRIVVDLTTHLDDNGIDVIFLNRDGKKKVKKWGDVEDCFKKPPSNTTPLTPALQKAFSKQKGHKPL